MLYFNTSPKLLFSLGEVLLQMIIHLKIKFIGHTIYYNKISLCLLYQKINLNQLYFQLKVFVFL